MIVFADTSFRSLHIQLMLGTRNERSPRTMSKAWDIHSQGLAELVQLRGPEQFARKEGRDLFWVVFNTIVSAIRVQLIL
jgi:hypothetical protein